MTIMSGCELMRVAKPSRSNVTVLNSVRSAPYISCAVLLLIASGYAPQLSIQLFLSLMALGAMAASDHQAIERIEWDAWALKRVAKPT